MEELFVLVKGFPGYFISNHGTLRCTVKYRNKSPHQRPGSLSAQGYLRHGMKGPKGKVVMTAHRMVALHFLPPPLPGQNVVRHLDGNKLNNVWTNLAWGSAKDNCQDTVAHGRTTRGLKNHFAKFSSEQVMEAHLFLQTHSLREACEKYGLSMASASRIKNGKHWALSQA